MDDQSNQAPLNAAAFPGEPQPDTQAMIRVDHAGEFGAARIYAGQLAVMGTRHPAWAEIARMKEQEKRHLETFERLVAERRVRPTLLAPLWDGAGFALGAVTALMGPRAAMACTAAVETEIDRHYAEQQEALGDGDPELRAHIDDFRAEEQEHRETAIRHGAEETPGYPVMSAVIRAGCRLAIAAAKRI